MAYTAIPAVSSGSGGFGSDTLVELPNSAAVDKTVSEWISAYSSNVAGAEQSTVEIKTLSAGVQVTGIKITGESLVVLPISWRYSADSDTGWDRSAANTMAAVCGGTQVVLINAGGLRLINQPIAMSSNGASFGYTAATGVVRVTPDTTLGQVQLGNAAALATNSTFGYVTVPSWAGAQTGTPANIPTGHVPWGFNTTTGRLEAYYGGAWHFVALT